nr:hypothetical protein [Tanacetum cinerariifolium]
VVDDDVDEQPIQDLALNVDKVFQADDCDAFDYDVDKAPTAHTMFMANLSSVDHVYDEAGLSYDSDVLFEVHGHDHYQDTICEHHEVHEIHDDVQSNYVVDSHTGYTSNSNMIPYDQYVKDNAVQVVQSDVFAIPNDAYMMILNYMHESPAQHVYVITQTNVIDKSLTAELATYKEQFELYERRARFELTKREHKIDEQLRIVITDRNIKEENLKNEHHSVKMQFASTINHNKSMVEEVTKEAIGYKNPLCLARAKQVQPALYNGHEIIKTNHVSAIVHNSEDTLEIAEITRKKMNKKMKTPLWTHHKINIRPPDYSNENFLATFTPQTQLTPKQIFWSKDVLQMKIEAPKEQAKAAKPVKASTVYPPNTPVKLVLRWEHPPLVVGTYTASRNSLLAVGMPCAFYSQQHLGGSGQGNNAWGSGAASYAGAQNRVGYANPGQARQIKCYNCNSIGGQDNVVDDDVDEQPIQDLALNVDNVFQADDYDAFDYDVDKAPTAHTMFMANLSSVDHVYDEAGPSYDSNVLFEVHGHDHYQDTICEHHEVHEMHDDVQSNYVVDSHTGYTSNSNMIPYDQNNKEVHLDYLKHLKESVATLHKIVEEAKVERPLDRSVVSACLYTKNFLELLEYVVHIVLWYLDSGYSKHMTGDRSRLRNFMKKFIGTVRFGNDHFGAIMGYGDYVLVVLICTLSHIMKSSSICLLSKASKTKSWLWYRRLNHLNFGTINDLARKYLVRGLPRLKFEKDYLCSACQLGRSKKHTHLSKAENSSLKVLNTLHMDLCGLMRVQTINGKKYILVIVDDYTRFTRVEFLRSKDETPEVVIKFLKQIQVSLNQTVKFIRTINGTEFFNHDLTH